MRSLQCVLFPALVVAALAAPACSGPCDCPEGGGVANVSVPAAHSSRITSLSATSPCTATVATSDTVAVYTTAAATCEVDVQLMNGDAYVFTVAFQSSGDTCCDPLVGGYTASIPERADAGAGGVAGLPMVPAGCAATCGTPAGPAQSSADVAAAAAAVAGRWKICGGWPSGLPSGVVGIELDPVVAEVNGVESGNANYLVSGPSGPVPGTAFGYLLTYDIEVWQADSGPVAYLVIHSAPGSGAAGVVRYSACPLELQIDVGSPGATLIPFGS
jgi:hypothetical protein